MFFEGNAIAFVGKRNGDLPGIIVKTSEYGFSFSFPLFANDFGLYSFQ